MFPRCNKANSLQETISNNIGPKVFTYEKKKKKIHNRFFIFAGVSFWVFFVTSVYLLCIIYNLCYNRMPDKLGKYTKYTEKNHCSLRGKKHPKTTTTFSKSYERSMPKILLSQAWYQPRSTFPKKANFWQTQQCQSSKQEGQHKQCWTIRQSLENDKFYFQNCISLTGTYIYIYFSTRYSWHCFLNLAKRLQNKTFLLKEAFKGIWSTICEEPSPAQWVLQWEKNLSSSKWKLL